MKDKMPPWGILALLALLALVLAAIVLPPLPKPKARASRINTAVNIISSCTVMIPNASALPGATMTK